MSPFKHTRGPWTVGRIDPSGSRRVEADKGQSAICYVAPWEDPTEDVEDPRMEANAQLIVAAPDLYVAAKGCLDSPMGPPGCYLVGPERMQALARAVSKAGKSRPGPLELLAQVHDEAKMLQAMEELFSEVGSQELVEKINAARTAFNTWKEKAK